MSYKALGWAWEMRGLNSSEKFVLVALADLADEQNSCFPGQEYLAGMIGASVSTVRRSLKSLEKAGLIERSERRRSSGYRTSDRYYLRVTESHRSK